MTQMEKTLKMIYKVCMLIPEMLKLIGSFFGKKQA